MKLSPPKIKSLRDSKGWSQEELAAQAGISLRTVCNAEKRAPVHPGTAKKLAKALGVEIGDLLDEERPPIGCELAAYVSTTVPSNIATELRSAAETQIPYLGLFAAEDSFQTRLLKSCSVLIVYSFDVVEDAVVREMVYAMGRQMQIVILHPEGHQAHLPSFIDVTDAEIIITADCVAAVKALGEWHSTSRSLVQLQHLLTVVASGRKGWEAAYQQPLISSRVKQAYDEVRAIAARKYRVTVSFESEYLQRATQVFETAKRVYATSLDGVSTFWSDAENYIAIQPNHTVRWFVLNDGNEIGRPTSQPIHTLLNAHSGQYGDTGCVFIGRRAEYEHFIQTHWPKEYVQRFLHSDFALLEHDTHAGTEWTFASLSRHEFVVQRFDDGHPCHAALELFKDAMEGIRKGGHASGRIQKDAHFGQFVRWTQGLGIDQKRRREFVSVLDNLFHRERVVTHMVFLDLNGAGREIRDKCRRSLIKVMNRIKSRLPEYQRTHGLIEVRYGRKVDVFEGGRTSPHQPPVITESPERNEVCLLMTFEDRSMKGAYATAADSLRQYYNENDHVADRFGLYREMGTVLEPIDQIYSHIESLDDNHPLKLILLECVEREITKHLVRRDYIDDLSWNDVLDV